MSTTTSRGFSIAYEVTGPVTGDVTAETVILLHGFGGRGGQWGGYVDALSSKRRVVTMDALGHGASDKPRDPDCYRTVDRAADVVAVLEAVGVDRAHVWGYSMGGRNAYAVGVHHPDRVRSLVVGGAGPVPDGDEGPWMTARANALLSGDWAEAWQLLGNPPESFRAGFEATNDCVALGAVSKGLLEWATLDPAVLAAHPTFHYTGTDDAFADRVRAAAAASGGELLELDDADHVSATFRVDEIVPAVTRFWETRCV